jgi:hypothetical protein
MRKLSLLIRSGIALVVLSSVSCATENSGQKEMPAVPGAGSSQHAVLSASPEKIDTPRQQGDAKVQEGVPVKPATAGTDKGIEREDQKTPDTQKELKPLSPNQHLLDSLQDARFKQKQKNHPPKP